MTAPKSLIINSPYHPPARHWEQARDGVLTLTEERRPASHEIFDVRNNTRRTEKLDIVNKVRNRVDTWRDANCPGITSVTRSLLEHWRDNSARQYPFYFCQIEAIETLIWWVEAPAEYKQGIQVPGDGGAWERLCSKMATGAGKTTVMAMIVAWQVLNAITYPNRNKDFSRTTLIVAPGLTVKDRLRVLYPGEQDNYYDAFAVCPSAALRQKLNQAQILIENWHTLMPLKQQARSVVRKGTESDKAFVRRVLGELANCKDIVVINDEAHHAYRIPPDTEINASADFDREEATRWIEGLDRINAQSRIIRCFDLSATPFVPTGRTNEQDKLFGWIVSDFGLNDAIEAGLVKTPRVVVRDDALPNAATMRSKLYHLYREPQVQDDLNRRGAEPHEALPKLVQDAYTLLGADWRAAAEAWQRSGHASPPVMLTVCNRIETAARISHYFDSGDVHWPELHNATRTLRVDSKVLDKAEIGEAAAADNDYEARLHEIVNAANIPATAKQRLLAEKKEVVLRALVDTVGKRGQPGQDLQAVISVAQLSEGWDAKNVTHIMGLRAFTSQLLCEQVIGRGLRRVGYDLDENGLLYPEYVNIFGVPLSIFQDVGGGGDPPPPPKASVQVESLKERNPLEIRWPNVLRVSPTVRPVLAIDWAKVETLKLNPSETPISAEIAPAVGGTTDWSKIHVIDLEQLPDEFRLQRLVFKAARKAFDSLQHRFAGTREYLVYQLVRIVEQFIDSDRLSVPSLFHQEAMRKRILISLNIDVVVQHILRFVEEQNTEKIELIFDPEYPIGSTRDMRTWYTTKPCVGTVKSQISHMIADSSWEQYAANLFESNDSVISYAKNEHLGFQIYYMWNGSRRRFIPDFLVRLNNGRILVLEIKGEDSEQNKAKRAALAAWIAGVNDKGGFGTWCWDVAFDPVQLQDILHEHCAIAL